MQIPDNQNNQTFEKNEINYNNYKVELDNFNAPYQNSVLRKLKKGYKRLNKKTMKYTYLLMLMAVGYEFLQNRILSNRVNEVQGKVDNLYKQVSEMKNGNKALEKK